MKEGIPWSLGK